MARRFLSRRGRSGPRRKYAWGGARVGGRLTVGADEVIAFWVRAPAGALDNTYSPPQVVEPDVTLIRTRCILGFGTDNGTVQSAAALNVGFGIIAWDGLTDDPLDAGLLPHPCLDQSLDWVFRNVQGEVLENIALASNGAASEDAYQSKAQRKLSNGTGLLFVAGYTTFLGTGPATLTLSFAADIRYLVKLP